MKNFTVIAYKVIEEMRIAVRAETRLEAEHEGRAYFEKRRKGWTPSKVDRLYRVEEEEQ